MSYLTRKLGVIENVFNSLHNLGGMIYVNVARIEGEIKPEILQEALNLLQKRHPLLQVHLVELEDGSYFCSEGTTTIPLQIIKKSRENLWLEVAKNELNQKINSEKNPACRVTLLQASASSIYNEIIASFNHGISDGLSCINFFQELLYFYQQISEGQNASDLTAMEFLQPLEKIVNPSYAPKNNIQELAPKPAPKRVKPQLIIEAKAPAKERQTHLLTRVLNAEITARAIDRCHQEKTTVHGALCAAMLFAVGKFNFNKIPVNLSCGSSMDLRPFCQPQVSKEQIGCYISLVNANHTLEADTEFWDLARECKLKITQSINSGIPLDLIFSEQLKSVNEAALIQGANNDNMGRQNTIEISNLGKANFDDFGGNFKLKEFYFGLAQHLIGASFWLGTVTFQQQMFCSFTHVTPLLSPKTAEILVDSFIDTIKNACSSESFLLMGNG